MLYDIILVLLPVVFLIGFCFKSIGKHNLARTSSVMIVIFMIITCFALGLYPDDLSIDKPRYAHMYYNSLIYGLSTEFRDAGWIVYNTICTYIFGDKIELFFLLTATIYLLGYFQIGRALFPHKNIGYFIIMSAGCLGFSNYGTNVIRAGVALSILLIAFSLHGKSVFKLLLVFVALSFQKSVFIPVLAFFGAKCLKSTKLVTCIWVVCLLLSAINVDMGPLFESVGFVDERIETYAETIGSESGSYEKGFRFDFLLYSIIPLFISFFYTYQNRIKDALYLLVVRVYLLANAVWLLAIRMAYSDRLAYLSWFLIPIITLYPALKYQDRFRNPSLIVLIVMSVFMGVRVLLWVRTMV